MTKKKFLDWCDLSPGSNNTRLDSQGWKQFCMNLFPKTFPKNQKGTTDADMLYASMLKDARATDPSAKTVSFEQFHDIGALRFREFAPCAGCPFQARRVIGRARAWQASWASPN